MESVWDYPRPPTVAPCEGIVRVEIAGTLLAESAEALRVLETSHPPTIYVPPDAVRSDLLVPSAARGTLCEFKGRAHYLDALVGDCRVAMVAWSYADPVPRYAVLRDHVAFYRA